MKCGCISNHVQQRLAAKCDRFQLPTLAELGVDVEDKYDGSENEVRNNFPFDGLLFMLKLYYEMELFGKFFSV